MNKNRDIQREILTIYSKKTNKDIKEYLEEQKYPDRVLSEIQYELTKQMKHGFRQTIDKNKRYKLIQFKINTWTISLEIGIGDKKTTKEWKENTIKNCIL